MLCTRGFPQRLLQKGITLEFTQKAVDFISESGFDREFGARPVKRAVQNLVENPLAKEILSTDTDNLTPLNALQTIARWKKALSGQ